MHLAITLTWTASLVHGVKTGSMTQSRLLRRFAARHRLHGGKSLTPPRIQALRRRRLPQDKASRQVDTADVDEKETAPTGVFPTGSFAPETYIGLWNGITAFREKAVRAQGGVCTPNYQRILQELNDFPRQDGKLISDRSGHAYMVTRDGKKNYLVGSQHSIINQGNTIPEFYFKFLENIYRLVASGEITEVYTEVDTTYGIEDYQARQEDGRGSVIRGSPHRTPITVALDVIITSMLKDFPNLKMKVLEDMKSRGKTDEDLPEEEDKDFQTLLGPHGLNAIINNCLKLIQEAAYVDGNARLFNLCLGLTQTCHSYVKQQQNRNGLWFDGDGAEGLHDGAKMFDKTLMIVGCAHLYGQHGLLKKYQDAGWTIEDITFTGEDPEAFWPSSLGINANDQKIAMVHEALRIILGLPLTNALTPQNRNAFSNLDKSPENQAAYDTLVNLLYEGFPSEFVRADFFDGMGPDNWTGVGQHNLMNKLWCHRNMNSAYRASKFNKNSIPRIKINGDGTPTFVCQVTSPINGSTGWFKSRDIQLETRIRVDTKTAHLILTRPDIELSNANVIRISAGNETSLMGLGSAQSRLTIEYNNNEGVRQADIQLVMGHDEAAKLLELCRDNGFEMQ